MKCFVKLWKEVFVKRWKHGISTDEFCEITKNYEKKVYVKKRKKWISRNEEFCETVKKRGIIEKKTGWIVLEERGKRRQRKSWMKNVEMMDFETSENSKFEWIIKKMKAVVSPRRNIEKGGGLNTFGTLWRYEWITCEKRST